MNVLFHTLAGGAVAVALVPPAITFSKGMGAMRCATAFLLGILSHGLLDWLPHCYPIPSKADVMVSLFLMSLILWRCKGAFRFLLLTAFAGALFPDILDLGPALLAKLTSWKIPPFPHLFPWHWPAYSGSVYNGDCALSNVVHLLFLGLIEGIFWWKKTFISESFLSKSNEKGNV